VAKPHPIDGLEPDRGLRRNARRILAVRIGEVWSYHPAVTDPMRVRELHDMRIACKRLRYLLEIFHVAFPHDLEPFIDGVKDLQDLLGDIHDRDIQVPMLRDHLERLAEREDLAVRGAPPEDPPSRPTASGEAALTRFHAQVEDAGAAAERPGVEALLARRIRERDELYARFLAEWGRIDATGFRDRLEGALGL